MSKTYKVVFNGCYGGFSLSEKAISRLKELGLNYDDDYEFNYIILERHHPLLIQVVEELGKEASGEYSKLCIATIDTPLYIIEEYDGFELVRTPDSIKWIKIDQSS